MMFSRSNWRHFRFMAEPCLRHEVRGGCTCQRHPREGGDPGHLATKVRLKFLRDVVTDRRTAAEAPPSANATLASRFRCTTINSRRIFSGLFCVWPVGGVYGLRIK